MSGYVVAILIEEFLLNNQEDYFFISGIAPTTSSFPHASPAERSRPQYPQLAPSFFNHGL